MTALRVPPEQIRALRESLYTGQQHVDAPTARRLIDEIDRLRDELARARVTFATKAATALEKRLADVGTFNRGGCPACHDAEARALLARLQRIVKTRVGPA